MQTPGLFYVIFATLWATVLPAAQSTTVNIQVLNQASERLQLPMSTSFQLAPFSYQFFDLTPNAPARLTALDPFHTNVQVIQTGIPLTAPHTWDFTELNDMFTAVQNTGDHSPEFQIGTAPAFMNDASGHIMPASFADFAAMSADLVRYYNVPGFSDSGVTYSSPTPYPVTWWGIFNEPNGNGLTPQQYVDLYNQTVPAMAQADPSIKFLAVELSDFPGAAAGFLPAFVTGVTAPVDVLATHLYSTCNQKDSDGQVFATLPGFVTEVQTIYSQLATNPALADVPVWVTENNVNADFDAGNGMSNCNPGQPFVLDLRGTSPFFAAWRSLVFILLGQNNVQALYHWSFAVNQQYGEVDSTATPYLSYWIDYYLSHWLPSPPGQDVLQTVQSGCCLWIYQGSNPMGLDTHTLAARNPDGSVVILMSNHAVKSDTDNNGSGTSRTFALDLSALGTFTSATQVTLDATTPSTGPVPVQLTPAAQMNVTLPGYGAALLRLANASPNLPPAGVSNAASYASGTIAPGELLALFGTSLGPSAPASLTLTNPRLVSNSLAGLHVWFNGIPAPVLYASTGQVNTVVPFELSGQAAAQLQVEYLGVLSPPVSIPVVATSPGIFTIDGSGTGPGAVRNIDESVNSADNPAARGEYVSIYATGAGLTAPAGVDGLLPTGAQYRVSAPVSVTIGGLPCQIQYAGAAPELVSGVLQVNALVPAGVTPGPSVPVQIQVGDTLSQPGVTLAVR